MNFMTDFETMGTASDTVVLSVGVCAFDRDGIHGKKLWEFDLEEQLNSGRSITADTLSWWAKQSDDARKVFEPSDFKIKMLPFFESVESFFDEELAKVKQKRESLILWGNGADFDVSLLANMYNLHHPKKYRAIPWKFWNVMCFRTFNQLTKCRDLIPKKQTGGVKHNALDDAIFQANCVLAFWDKKKGGEK